MITHTTVAGTYTLEDVPVLVKTLLGKVRLFQVNTQLQILEHNGLKQFLRVGAAHLAPFDDLIEDLKGSIGFPHIDKFCKAERKMTKP